MFIKCSHESLEISVSRIVIRNLNILNLKATVTFKHVHAVSALGANLAYITWKFTNFAPTCTIYYKNNRNSGTNNESRQVTGVYKNWHK